MHVLLDKKGKTLSHAFVEMATPDAAKAALRTSQNSVLGKGKRARGVTVTRSNQEELMRAVSVVRFPASGPESLISTTLRLRCTVVPIVARQL